MTPAEIARFAGLAVIVAAPVWAALAAVNVASLLRRERPFVPVLLPIAAAGACVFLGAGLFGLGVVADLDSAASPAFLLMPLASVAIGLGILGTTVRAALVRGGP